MKRTVSSLSRHARGAFTLFELLVVVGIILLLLALMTPSVAELVKSNNFSSAVNQLAGTLEAARERAIARNKQTAVAVLFDLDTKRCRLLILDEVSDRGDLADEAELPGQDATVFVPASNASPVVLPEGVMIFGLTNAGVLNADAPDGNPTNGGRYEAMRSGNGTYEEAVISEGTSDDERDVRTTGWYAGARVPNADGDGVINPWLAPRNDPRIYLNPRPGEDETIEAPLRDVAQVPLEDIWAIARGDDPETPGLDQLTNTQMISYIRHAQSFMIRFSPEGSVITLSADTTQIDQTGYAYIEFSETPVASGAGVLDEMVGKPFDNPNRFDPESLPRDRTITTEDPPPTFSYESAGTNPEVLLIAAVQLAVVDLQDLQRGTSISSPWRVRGAITDPEHQAPWPDVFIADDESLITEPDELDALVRVMSDWIDSNAVIVDFSRHSGRVIRR